MKILYENEYGEKLVYSSNEVEEEINYWASFLKKLHIKKGNIVTLYLPQIPETLFLMLACARIGAVHNVIFAGLGTQAILDRIKGTKLILTTEYTMRRGQKIMLSEVLNETDLNYIEIPRGQRHEGFTVEEEYNDDLFTLYTSGTTGKPKKVTHQRDNYLEWVGFTFTELCREGVYFCTADFGWITGHSYNVYAPYLHDKTILIYEGLPKVWELVEKYKVTALYTAPTLLRMLKSEGKPLNDISSLKIIGSVGEILDPATREWTEKIAEVKDTWWQTETGGFMIVNGVPLPTVKASIKNGELIVIRDKIYKTGDLAKIENGKIILEGRKDDLLNPAGHRITPAEIENIVLQDPNVTDVAIVGVPDSIRGQRLIMYIVGKASEAEIIYRVKTKYGALGVPSEVKFVDELPKTRSGKIQRRKLRDK